MKDEKYLYVPISVKGLIVGENSNGSKYFQTFYDYTKLNENILGHNTENEFDLKGNIEPGIHLHWSMPDALTRGKAGGNDNSKNKDDIDFYCLPNRWLVSRIWIDDENFHIKNWMIESDAIRKKNIPNNAGSHTIADFSDEKNPCYYMGESYKFQKEYSASQHTDYVKPVEQGDSTYTAYYPSSRNMFGFYDDMTDDNEKELDKASVCYCISGWYSNTEHDPLRKVTDRQKCQEEFNWELMNEEPFGKILVLCHGMLLNVNWKGRTADYKSEIPDNKPYICIGNTTSEAASVNDNPVKERLMNHLISGNYNLSESQFSIIEAENQLHYERFSDVYSSADYILKPKDINEKSEAFDEELFKINNLKDKALKLEKEIKDKKQELYDSWVRYILLEGSGAYDGAESGYSEISAFIREIDNDKKALDAVRQEFSIALCEFENKLYGSNYELSSVNKGRYYYPNNIIMLLKQVKRDYTHGFDSRFSENEFLKVRVNTAKLFLSDKKSGKLFTVDDDDLVKHEEYSDKKNLLSGLKSLINEAILYNKDFEDLIVTILSKKDGLDIYRNELRTAIKKLRLMPDLNVFIKKRCAYDIKYDGEVIGDIPSKVAVTEHSQPWNPLYLVWQCDYYADPELINNPEEITGWKKEGTDYTLISPERISEISSRFTGKAVITPHLSKLLKERLNRLNYNSEYAEDIAVLSQELDGINQKLIQRDSKVQFKPFDIYQGNPTLAKRVNECLDNFDFNQCRFDTVFSPLRAGLLKFTKLWIVDSFGQVQELDEKNIKISDNLKLKNNDDFVMLPPRILQPARLNFNWVYNGSAENSSPVYGFILANIMDCSISIFDENGLHLGYFQHSDDGAVKWINIDDPKNKSGSLPENINGDLHKFMRAIFSNENKNIISYLVKCIDTSLNSINPLNTSQLDPVNLLLGKPLALIKAEIGFETMQELIKQKFLTAKSDNQNDVDISKVNLKTYIGQPNNHNDGTIGFFADEDYNTLRLALSFSALKEMTGLDYSENNYFSEDNYVKLKFNSCARKVTVLADPIGNINIESLLLPMVTARVEQQLVSRILDNLFHTFFTAPVLTAASEINIPVPEVDGKVWTYSYYSKDGGFVKNVKVISSGEADNFEDMPLFAYDGWLKMNKPKI